ncbi:MAG: hypothetical protein ACR2QC_09950, partial [Gammaproteobacteria bacterium]
MSVFLKRASAFFAAFLLASVVGCGGGGGGPDFGSGPSTNIGDNDNNDDDGTEESDVELVVVVDSKANADLNLRAMDGNGGEQMVPITPDVLDNLTSGQSPTVTLSDLSESSGAVFVTIARTIVETADGFTVTLLPQTIIIAARPAVLATVRGETVTVSASDGRLDDYPTAHISTATITANVTLAHGANPRDREYAATITVTPGGTYT